MDNFQNWIVVAEECEAFAAAAKAQVNRDMLLAAAARWRRMARVARDLEEVTKLDQMDRPDLILEPVSRHQR
jgi:hypothetical protein